MSDTNNAAPPADTPPADTPPADTGLKPNETLLGDNQKPTEPDSKDPPKDGEPDKKDPTKPTPIDLKALKLPEGMSLDEAKIQPLVDILSDEALSPQDRTQRLLDLHVNALKEAVEGPSKHWDEVHKTWLKEISADKDIGTGNPESPAKPEALAAMAKVLTAYGSPELRQVLDMTGAGNNPHVAKFLWNISKITTEGGHHAGKGPNPPLQDPAARMGFNFNPPTSGA